MNIKIEKLENGKYIFTDDRSKKFGFDTLADALQRATDEFNPVIQEARHQARLGKVFGVVETAQTLGAPSDETLAQAVHDAANALRLAFKQANDAGLLVERNCGASLDAFLFTVARPVQITEPEQKTEP